MFCTLAAGFTLGLLEACIGAWKDVRWEPFRWRSFVRSPILCCGWSAVLAQLFSGAPWFLIALASLAPERIGVEFWKGVLRKQPSKFRDPERDTGWLRKQVIVLSRKQQAEP